MKRLAFLAVLAVGTSEWGGATRAPDSGMSSVAGELVKVPRSFQVWNLPMGAIQLNAFTNIRAPAAGLGDHPETNVLAINDPAECGP